MASKGDTDKASLRGAARAHVPPLGESAGGRLRGGDCRSTAGRVGSGLGRALSLCALMVVALAFAPGAWAAKPLSVSLSGPTATCQSAAVTIIATAKSGSPPYTYSFTQTPPGGAPYVCTNPSGPCSFTPNTSSTGSFTIAVTVTDSAVPASTARASQTLTVNAVPTVSVSPTSKAICPGQTATFTAAGSGGSGSGYSYSWSGPNSFIATTASISVSAAGSYTAKVTDSNGCASAPAAATLSVNTAPSVSVSPTSTAICLGQTATITAAGSGGSGSGYSYSWSGPSGFTASTASISVSAAGTYTVTVTDANGCTSASASASLTVNPPPVFTSCPGNMTLPVTCLPGGIIGAVPSFNPPTATDECGVASILCTAPLGAGGASVAVTSGVTAFPPGKTTVTCTATDNLGNSSTCSFTVSLTYQSSGLLAPLNASNTLWKIGSTIPVAFQLTGASSCVTTASATLSLKRVSKTPTGTSLQTGSTQPPSTGSQFQYAGGQYLYYLGTSKLSKGNWQISIDLHDGLGAQLAGMFSLTN
jgi:PKD domain-containing protein